MKLSKVLGVTTLVSGLACVAAFVANESRMENDNRLYWTQEMVRKYNPDKYNEMKSQGIDDLNSWLEAESQLKDSIERARIFESNAHRVYFEGAHNKKDSV